MNKNGYYFVNPWLSRQFM